MGTLAVAPETFPRRSGHLSTRKRHEGRRHQITRFVAAAEYVGDKRADITWRGTRKLDQADVRVP